MLKFPSGRPWTTFSLGDFIKILIQCKGNNPNLKWSFPYSKRKREKDSTLKKDFSCKKKES